MAFNPLHYRSTQGAIGSPEDEIATDTTQSWSMISLLKAIFGRLGSSLTAKLETPDGDSLVDDTNDLLKVQTVPGQNGVAAGAGAATAATQRVTVATDDALHTKLGEVQASPTANTVLARLKDLLTGIVLAAGTNLIGKVGIDQTTPGTTNAVAPISGQNGVAAGAGANSATTQRVTIATDDGLHTKIGEVQASPTANTVLDRLKQLLTGIVLAAGSNTIGNVTAEGKTPNGSAIGTQNPNVAGSMVRTSNIQASTGQAIWDTATQNGAKIVKPYSIPHLDWAYAAAASGILNTTTAVTIKAAAGAGISNFITGISVAAEALTNATELAIRDGAGGAVLWRIKIPTNGLPLTNIQFPTPLRGTNNTLLEVVTLTASGAGAVYFNAQGYAAHYA